MGFESNIDFDELQKEAEGILVRLSEIIDEMSELTIEDSNLVSKKDQLKAVSKSIQALERKNVPVPDSLRDMKTNLYSEIELVNEGKNQLDHINTGLLAVLKKIEKYQPARKRGKRKRQFTSEKPSTHHSVFRPLIVKALKEFGGQGTLQDVLDWIEKEMEGKFLPGDFELRSRGKPTWAIRVQLERSSMVKDGIIDKDSPFGVWKLNE